MAKSSGLIQWAVGSFPSVTGVTFEGDSSYGPGEFSLQINSNSFSATSATLCQGCTGAEQFIFTNDPSYQLGGSGVFIQYWLFNLASCPPSWTPLSKQDPELGCFVNSPMTPIAAAIPAADLGGLSLYASATGGTDAVVLVAPNGADATERDNILNLQDYWNTAEFNVFGDCCSTNAVFSASTIVVQTSIYDGTLNAPTCMSGGPTLETNTLTLIPAPAPVCLSTVLDTASRGIVPTIEFMESSASPPFPPFVVTGSASSVTDSTAQLGGSVNPNGSETLAWYEYSTSGITLGCNSPPTLTLPIQFNAGSGTATVPFYANIGGLSPDTTYYFVACALYPGGLGAGSMASFITTGPTSPPSLNGPSASAVTSSTVTLNDTVNPNGPDTQAWFEYSTSTPTCSLPTATQAQDVGAGTAYVPFSANITGLSSNTTYNFIACASNAGGVVASATGTFTTFTQQSVNATITAVVNGASFVGGGVVPGEIATAFGTNLTSSTGINLTSGLPLPATFLNDTLMVNNTPVALFAVDNVNGQQQINFQVPWEVASGPNASFAIANNSTTSASISLPVLAAQPGIFNYSVGENTFGSILHANFQLANTANPAMPGETVLIYCTGLGAVDSPPTDGEPGEGQSTMATPTVTIGGTNATVSFSGLAPDFVGLYQVNVEVPKGLATGNQPVVIAQAGASSNSVLLPVQ